MPHSESAPIPGRPARARLRRRLQPRAVARGGLGTRTSRSCARPASPGQRRRSSPGRCWSPPRAATTSAGSTACSTCCTPTASRVDLATPTAVAARLVLRAHPEALPVDPRRASGSRFGSRAGVLPELARRTAQAALRIAERLGRALRRPPGASLMWHVHNEYGATIAECYCDTAPRRFRDWLRGRYGDLDALNDAWGTAFWSQRYSDWDADRLPPRATPRSATRPSGWTSRRFCRRRTAGLLHRRARRAARG